MQATLIRLLGAVAPNTEAGTKYGAAMVAAVALVFRKPRRVIPCSVEVLSNIVVRTLFAVEALAQRACDHTSA